MGVVVNNLKTTLLLLCLFVADPCFSNFLEDCKTLIKYNDATLLSSELKSRERNSEEGRLLLNYARRHDSSRAIIDSLLAYYYSRDGLSLFFRAPRPFFGFDDDGRAWFGRPPPEEAEDAEEAEGGEGGEEAEEEDLLDRLSLAVLPPDEEGDESVDLWGRLSLTVLSPTDLRGVGARQRLRRGRSGSLLVTEKGVAMAGMGIGSGS